MPDGDPFPTPLEIKALADDYGYAERRGEASSTLFFRESNPENPRYPILINVFYTTRGIMTQLPHPNKGYNSLWRSSAYDSLEMLAMLFENPRAHTGKGYRQAKDAVRGCAKCGDQKRRGEYSSNQWRAGPGKAVCSGCVAGKNGAGDGGDQKSEIASGKVKQERNAGDDGGGSQNGGKNGKGKNSKGKSNNGNDGGNDAGLPRHRFVGVRHNNNNNNNSAVNNHDEEDDEEDDEEFPKLSADALKQHNKQQKKLQPQIKSAMERRQFNCPLCPEEGRGKHVFFKRVPVHKPIVKCPKCKRAKQRRCERLYPIPRGEEKGYGHYRCADCKSTWGSSRAIGNVGQQCHVCELRGSPNHFVKPFRIEAFKSGKGGGMAGGGRRMKRVTREPIAEDEENEGGFGYTPADRQRFHSGAGNLLAGGGGGGGSMGGGGYGGGGGGGGGFDWEARDDGPEPAPAASRLSQYKSAARHRCEGCATGACRRRKLPVSGVHDVRDGDTASTSGSVVTNSEIDKAEFTDRDVDFDDWESDDGEASYVTMGNNGKMLRG